MPLKDRREYDKNRSQNPLNKARLKAYNHSDKGKATKKAYELSDAAKAVRKAYELSRITYPRPQS